MASSSSYPGLEGGGSAGSCGYVVGCDDGVVRKLGWMSGETLVACVKWGLRPPRPAGIAMAPVRVDGLDATSIVMGLMEVLGARGCPLVLDSLTVAGFNLVSPGSLFKAMGSPVIVVYTYRPSYERLEEGLRRSGLPHAELRLRVLSLVESSVRVETPKGPLYMIARGISVREAVRLVAELQVHARKPEPVRVAHYTASEAVRALRPS